MNRKTAAVLLCLPLLLGGCDAFFTNIFEGLAPLKVPSASELGSLSVSELERLAEDPDFFEALAADPEKLDAVKTSLLAKFDALADTPEEQRAAALYAEILLKTSGADEIAAGLASFASGGGFDLLETDLSAAVADLFGDSLPTLLEIEAMVDALDLAWDAYAAIGAGLATADLDDSLNAGDIAFNAALAAALQGVSLTGSLAGYIYDSIHSNPLGAYDPVSFDDAVLAGPEMGNLLSAAGFDPAYLGL